MRSALIGTLSALLFSGCIIVEDDFFDSDGDGVEDRFDDCPATPFGVAVDSFGCPIVSAPGTYDECEIDSDCGELNDFCLPLASSTVSTGICSRSCTDTFSCPVTPSGFEPLCLSTGSGFFCVETCVDSGDCQSGFSCEIIESGDAICVPR